MVYSLCYTTHAVMCVSENTFAIATICFEYYTQKDVFRLLQANEKTIERWLKVVIGLEWSIAEGGLSDFTSIPNLKFSLVICIYLPRPASWLCIIATYHTLEMPIFIRRCVTTVNTMIWNIYNLYVQIKNSLIK